MTEEVVKKRGGRPRKDAIKPAATTSTRKKKVLKRRKEDVIADAIKSLRTRNLHAVFVFGMDEFTEPFLDAIGNAQDFKIFFSGEDNNQVDQMYSILVHKPYSMKRVNYVNPQAAWSGNWADALIFGTEESFQKYCPPSETGIEDAYKAIIVLEKF